MISYIIRMKTKVEADSVIESWLAFFYFWSLLKDERREDTCTHGLILIILACTSVSVVSAPAQAVADEIVPRLQCNPCYRRHQVKVLSRVGGLLNHIILQCMAVTYRSTSPKKMQCRNKSPSHSRL